MSGGEPKEVEQDLVCDLVKHSIGTKDYRVMKQTE